MPDHFPPMVHELPPPQSKVAPRRPYRATRDPKRLPVPFIPFPLPYLTDPRFAPGPPSRGFYLWDEVPRVKLRGLGPADSLILRHAIAANLFDPRGIYLAPLVPSTPPGEPLGHDVPSSNLLASPDAPLQPDYIVEGLLWMAKHPRPPYSLLPDEAAGRGPYPKLPDALVVEIKPNAGYVALGQVLCYHFAWTEHYGSDWPLQPAILTDLPRPYLPRLAHAYGVSLFALGNLIVEPPPWPT